MSPDRSESEPSQVSPASDPGTEIHQPALSLVIPSLNTRRHLERMLSSLKEHAGSHQVQVIVVDMGSTDGSTDLVRNGFPDAVLIEGVPNRGYGAAINVGLQRVSSRDVLACNSDLAFTEGSIDAIIRLLATIDGSTLVGFRLCGLDGGTQRSVHRLPGRFAFTWMFAAPIRYWPALNSYLLGHMDEEQIRDMTEVGWLTGAALAGRKSLFTGLGGFDEAFFMNSEEIDLCRRVWDSGGRVLFAPSITLVHVGGGSSSDTGRALLWLAEGKARYTRKHYGVVVLAVARTAAMAAYASSFAVWIGRFILGRAKWEETVNEAARYGRALWSR
jgi:GT2 family glycosyltransferase